MWLVTRKACMNEGAIPHQICYTYHRIYITLMLPSGGCFLEHLDCLITLIKLHRN